MKTIAIIGSSGFLGKQICNFFQNKYQIIKIKRTDYMIDPMELAEKLESSNIIINLAGARISLFSSKRYRKEIYNSRILTSRNLVEAVNKMKRKPEIYISMSAIGIYDNEQVHDESSKNYGNDYLSVLCQDWENTISKLKLQNINTLVIRSGIVLDRNDGMLKKLLTPFKFGLGAIIGNGKQTVSFMHIEDFLNAFDFVLSKKLTGIINFVAPTFCTNYDLSLAISYQLNKPLFLRIPSFLVKIIMGSQSSMILEGKKVVPEVLLENGFSFKYSNIDSAVCNLLNKTEIEPH
jgi:uncharacterized protein